MQVEFHDADAYEKWFRSLAPPVRRRLHAKLVFVARAGGSRVGMPVVRHLGDGLLELRVAWIRVYFTEHDETMVVLAAGRKDTQDRDISRARRRMT